MTQRDRVLSMLRDGPVCGTELLRAHIPRYAARAWELRQEGFDIRSRRCQFHIHITPQTEYVLYEERQLAMEVTA
jgi:hypothetical protein